MGWPLAALITYRSSSQMLEMNISVIEYTITSSHMPPSFLFKMNQRQIIILIGHFCAAAALQSLFE
jgi:hypothetical protein